MKLVFPSTLAVIGDKLNSVVNYKAALTSLGEGISGEKKFATALGEAFTYAFTGGLDAPEDNAEQTQAVDDTQTDQASTVTAASDSVAEGDNNAAVTDTNANEDAAAVFAEDESTGADADSASNADADASVKSNEETITNAIVAAFIQSQQEYSDYSIPAGVTYEMPRISVSHEKPLDGTVSSPFGYRLHPVDKVVKFHYGTDIAAKKGTPITAFSAGKVLAVGESTTLGKYAIIAQGDIETQYAHCGSLFVSSGQTVKMGDQVATVGDSGNATDSCLHFELKVNGVYVNPEYYF